MSGLGMRESQEEEGRPQGCMGEKIFPQTSEVRLLPHHTVNLLWFHGGLNLRCGSSLIVSKQRVTLVNLFFPSFAFSLVGYATHRST